MYRLEGIVPKRICMKGTKSVGRAHIVAVCQSAHSTAVYAECRGDWRSKCPFVDALPQHTLWPIATGPMSLSHPELTRHCGYHNSCEQMWDTCGRGVCGREVQLSALEGEARCGRCHFIGLASVASL